ncbi:hypothetical protein XdyCFBP7245_18865 [Xanthomonas dyei]|uniref:Uncharacterized protein n=1 Tax=Xanthomonas dyei TaxID=743699 RepID=A0A2S7BY44_9XANT|nr:hypothetical protein XdyCFBP7245_18865 [Xanthomonas dyei]
MAHLIGTLSVKNLQWMTEIWGHSKNNLPYLGHPIDQWRTIFVVNTNYIIDVRAIPKCHWSISNSCCKRYISDTVFVLEVGISHCLVIVLVVNWLMSIQRTGRYFSGLVLILDGF